MPIRDKVYDKLKSIGLTDSKEDFFKYYDNDENVRKQAYNKLRDAGLTDTEEDFYEYMKPQQTMAQKLNAQSTEEPYTHEYDENMNLVGGTAYEGPEPYQYKPEVQQHILQNKPDMFKPKTVDMYGAHSKDKTEMDMLQEGRLYDMKDARQNWLQRPITTFGESFEQGTDALYQGGKNLVGETANIVTGSQRDYQRAKNQLDELVSSGYDLSNFDAEQALKAFKDRDYQRKMNEWQRNIDSRKAEREDMGFFESLLHKMQDPSRPKSQYEETGMFADELQLARSYQAIQDALQRSNGNVQEAYKLLGQQASKETWGDKTTREARQALANQRPTEGLSAWVGGMIPQMIGTGAGIVASLNPYTRWLARPLGMTNMAFLTGATSGMSMAEARQYAEEKGLPINEGDVWRTGVVDAAIEYGTEKIPFNRYFGRVQDVTKKIISKGVADAALNNDAVQNEVSDLLQRASKEFRNGLFTKENLKEYLKDVGTEGVSEFMAEALQTLSPIIYQNPEDYPTLTEVLNNGLEGAKGGLFMGAFLGGGSLYSANRMQNYANRKRRESQGAVSFIETDKGIFEVLGQKNGVYSVMDSNGEESEVTVDQVRDQVSVSLEEFDASMKEARESHIQDAVESENAEIDAATDLQTGMYGEVTMIDHDENGEQIDVTVNVYGEKVVNGKLYLLVEKDGKKDYIRPMQYYPESYQKRPAEEVKALNEEMIREEAAQQAEMEAKYAPEVINAQMQQGVPFDTPNAQIVPVAPMPEGNGWIVEEYALDTNNKVAKTPIVRELTNDEYRDMLQAQLNAEEAAQEQIAAEEQAAAPEVVEEVQPTEEADVKENFTTETGNNLSPVEEVAQTQAEVKPQTPVIPTKEDGSIDFVSYGKEGTFKTLGEKYGEKMPNKVDVTAKALAEDLKKAQDKLQKAEEAYDNAPIGREQKAEEARDKAKQELEAIQREANFWAEMDAEIKDAQARRESMLNPQAEVETSTEPMNVDEFVAQQLASGNIVLDKEDYKKETGYGDTEANAMNGGATKLFGKNGMTIQEAGERLMEIDRENGTNFFDQLDSNSGRDALINVLGSVKSRKELNQYIATNRAEQAKRESEGLRNELEKQAMEANYASLEDYVLQMEVEEMENPFLNDRADEIMAIFAEEAAKYEQSLNNTENGQGTENEVVEGNDSILPEEQLDNTGGTEVSEESERIGDGTSEESESTHAATEVELKQEEGETTLQFAERAAEENRRRPLRKRAEEWSNTLGIKVTYLESIDDVDAKTRAQIEAAHAKGESVPGWVNKKGEVFFFMPDLSDLKDVDDTYIHEVVAHVGLPQLLGKERFGELCDKVWDMMPQSEKDYYYNYPGVNSTDDSTKEGKIERQRRAADEYIAHIAEQQNFTPEEKTIWDNIVKMFREMLDKALNGIISKSKLTDEDISNLIKASYANLKRGAEGNVSGEGTKFRAKWRKGQLDKASRTIRRWLENNTRGKSFEIELPKATLDKVRKAMGRDFESHNITSNGIVHALKNHGENGLKLTGISIPLSKEDVELIPYIMTSPDRVEKASTDASGRESVRFYKDLSNGYVVVVEKEYKNSPDDMETITMWAELSSKATNAQQNAAPDTHVRNAILSIDIAKIRKDAEDAIEEDENRKEKTSFRVVKDKNGNKSLVGLHNISEDKLKKAIKQGGLANPSMAVIDMDKQSHVDYGDITLVAPESLVDKKLGKNIGTYMADAYTPVYPTVVKKLSDKGGKALTKALEPVDETFRSKVRTYFNSYLETGTHYDALAYWYLSDTGKNPPILEAALPEGFTKEEVEKVKSINSEADSFFQLSEDEKQKALYLYADKFFGGIKEYENHLADYTKRMQEVVQDESKPQFVRKNIQQNLNAIERYGYEYDRVAGYYNRAVFLASRQSKPSEFETFRNAFDEVSKNGLEEDFGNWMTAKEAELGVEEKLFAGYDNQGRAKYLPNTLENASKLMKKEGRSGATGLGGFDYFVSILAPVAKTTKEINKKKGNLSIQEEYDAFAKKWSEYYHDLALQLQPGADKWADYGYHRLHEIAPMSNPKDYVKREYGIELSDKFIKDLNEVKTAIKNDFPARYFETKFERPVYLNEFAAAVVPQGISKDVMDALAEAGLPIEEYERDNNEARMAAVDKVASEIEGVRFRISEKGKQIQAEVDKFTSKYNSKPVELIDPEMTDEEIEDAIDWQQTAKDLKAYIKESKSMGGYVGELGKILIFVENMKLERMEEAMFHENLHPFVDGGEYDHLLNKLYENGKDDEALSRARRFSDREPKAKRPLEFFNYAVSYGQVNGDLDDVLKYFDKEEQAELLNLLKENGYDYYQEQEGRRGNAVLDGLPRGEENAERVLQHQEGGQENNGRVSSESQEEKLSPTERKARLNELFNKVADMGLQGVLGNKEYTSLMVDIYKALPEEVRAEIAEDALRLYGGSVATAVSDYIGPKSKNSIMDKVVTIVREALRKIGFDLDLNANEVRYMAWRSKKPLDRNNMFEVAEDIDMRYRLKVGEYDGSPTPDGGGTRFSVKSKPKTKAELKEEVRDLKEDVRGLKDEVRDLKKQVNTLRSGNKYEWEKKQRAIVSFIKGRLTKEAGSVLGKTRLDQLITLVNKASTATDLHKPLQFIEQVINDASIEHAASKMDKLIKTKLQGETNRGVAKGVVVDETTRRLFDSIRGTFKDLIVTSIDSELRSVRGEILRFGKEINALPEDDVQGRAILTARQDALKERRKELEKEQEELQRHNVTETKESLERRHDELVEAMDAHIEGEGVWTQEMQDEYDSIPLRLKLAEIRESQSQLDAILADAIMTRRNAYKNNGETRKKMLAEADVIESNYTIAQEELIRLMNEVSDELNAIIKEGKSRLAKRKQALAERRIAIVTMGISAVKDKKIKDPNAILSRKEKFDKWFDNSWLKSVSDFMTAPLNSFNFMLKYIDRNHTIGEGELYNHFMKSEEGALEANNRLYDGLKAYNTAIEEKAKEIFGKDIESVMKDSGKEYTDKVYKQYMYDSSSHKEGEMYPISITKGQALYVWLTWRQDDGRAKLVADGWNDQSIEEIEALIGEDYIKFGEWITDEFFPMLREEKYNKTHIDMFGTSMAKREHYFPFKVQSEDIQEKGEMGESYSGMPSTITGNIIKRTINKSRIKTDQNAFDLLYKYGNDMETWNAMAKLRQDLNFLHSSKAFRNYLDANSKGLFDKFIKSAEVAVKAYNNSGESNAINDFLVKMNRMWAGSNIGFRLNTAMKQILSYPAFMAYSSNPKYLANLAKYSMNWNGNLLWARENLPAFRQRVETGDLGMKGMSDPQFDLGKYLKMYSDISMIPNQFVDALTCAAGARSVYDFEYNRAIKAGLSEEEARNIAQYNAEVAFNETQQSSRDEFVSPIQMSRNVLIKSMMNYQNSNVGYQRLGNEGLLEIMRAKHVYEQDIKDGMSEEEAKSKLRKSIVRGSRKVMVAFTILPGLWYLGSQGIVGITSPIISSLFGGGDDDEPYLDDEAKEGLMLSMALGTVAGTTGGQLISNVVQGMNYNPMAWFEEFQKDISKSMKEGFNLNVIKNTALKLAQYVGGINVETWENIYLAEEHAIRTGNFDLVDFMFLINLPPSQRKKMAEELYSDMPFMEYAEKVSRAQKLFDDYRKNLPYAKGDKNGSKKNAIKKQYVIENLSNDKQDKLEKEKEFKKLQREYGNAEDKKEWIEEHPEYKELEKNFKSQEVTKEVNREAKKLK